jgi:hypothetical protein
VKAYKSRPRKARGEDGGPGQPYSRGIDWRSIIGQIEAEGHLDEWASPDELVGQPRVNSLYAIVSAKQHPVLRELAEEGYTITPATTNNVMREGVRTGDLLLRVTKEG